MEQRMQPGTWKLGFRHGGLTPKERGGSYMYTRWVKGGGFVAALLSIAVLLTPVQGRALDVGDKAPDFLMHGTVEDTVRLSDYHGKKHVVLFFFVAAFTSV